MTARPDGDSTEEPRPLADKIGVFRLSRPAVMEQDVQHLSTAIRVMVWPVKLDDEDYTRLLSLRVRLRRFERWSAEQARAAGLTPAQHQLLLAVRGHDDPRGPTTGQLADYLLLQHHSTVGLIDRAEAAGLITRTRAEEDHRVVRLNLTADGARRLDGLSATHLEELTRLTPHLPGGW